MIETKTTVLTATCDACKKDLRFKPMMKNINYALVHFKFGYGSSLDDLGDLSGDAKQYHLCEKCITKALAAVGIKLKRGRPVRKTV